MSPAGSQNPGGKKPACQDLAPLASEMREPDGARVPGCGPLSPSPPVDASPLPGRVEFQNPVSCPVSRVTPVARRLPWPRDEVPAACLNWFLTCVADRGPCCSFWECRGGCTPQPLRIEKPCRGLVGPKRPRCPRGQGSRGVQAHKPARRGCRGPWLGWVCGGHL